MQLETTEILWRQHQLNLVEDSSEVTENITLVFLSVSRQGSIKQEWPTKF